jgi:manganese oxidase
MPLPDNTLPMMTGWGQFGAIEMGGMFSVVKVREGLSATDYGDPGWYKHPEGTVSYEWKGDVPEAVQSDDAKTKTPMKKKKVDHTKHDSNG